MAFMSKPKDTQQKRRKFKPPRIRNMHLLPQKRRSDRLGQGTLSNRKRRKTDLSPLRGNKQPMIISTVCYITKHKLETMKYEK